MKKKPLLFIALCITTLCLTQQADAKIWRINNQSNYNGATLWGDNFGGTATRPVFAEIDDAVSAAGSGDTLHVEGSPGIYATGTITKKLVIIGAGYFVTQNPKTSANTLDTKITSLFFDAGSDGSMVMGCNIAVEGHGAPAGTIDIRADGITIKRCRIELWLRLHTGITDLYILENFFGLATSGNSVVGVLSTPGGAFVPPTGFIFNNNICQGALWWGFPNVTPTTLWPIEQCNNNVFDGKDNLASPSLAFSTSEFKNNILMSTNAIVNIDTSGGPGISAYNIGTLPAQFGTANNNLVVPTITSLFISSTSTDGAYQIAPASQASNNGSDGTDRGAFGGSAAVSRYTLSGLAPIPAIYQISIPGATSTNLPVTISARTIK